MLVMLHRCMLRLIYAFARGPRDVLTQCTVCSVPLGPYIHTTNNISVRYGIAMVKVVTVRAVACAAEKHKYTRKVKLTSNLVCAALSRAHVQEQQGKHMYDVCVSSIRIDTSTSDCNCELKKKGSTISADHFNTSTARSRPPRDPQAQAKHIPRTRQHAHARTR